jgi:hypothetical protein
MIITLAITKLEPETTKNTKFLILNSYRWTTF